MLKRRRLVSSAPRLAVRLARQIKKSVGPDAEMAQLDFLSTGSTNLNLALSGKPNGGWARGRVLNLVGDGSTGKTLEALELAFWCWKNIQNIKPRHFPQVKKIKIVYNNAEEFLDMPIVKMYGREFYDAVDWRHKPSPEETIKDIGGEVKKIKNGDFLLYIIDSWDALQSIEEKKKFEIAIKTGNEMKAPQLGKKATAAQTFFKWLVGAIDGKDATIFVISQVRDIIGAQYGPKKKRAGGSALDFYTHQVLWLREIEKMTIKRMGHERVVGIRVEGKVKRSKVSKPFRSAEFQILFDMGIDDVNSMIDFIYGPRKTKKLKWNGKVFKHRSKLIQYIEKNNQECRLVEKTKKIWEKIEEASDTTIGRKRRY